MGLTTRDNISEAFFSVFDEGQSSEVNFLDNMVRLFSGVFIILKIFESENKKSIETIFYSENVPELCNVSGDLFDFTTVIHPSDLEVLLNCLEKNHASNDCGPMQFILRLGSPPGNWKWIVFSCRAIRDPDRRNTRVMMWGLETDRMSNFKSGFERYIRETSFLRDKGDRFQTLTRREKDVLYLLAQGNTNRQTALELGITEPTVKTHRKKIVRKLNTSNPLELVSYLAFFR